MRKGNPQARKLREKEVYDRLKGRGETDYYAWDRNLMSELYGERVGFQKKALSRYVRGKRVLILGCGRGGVVKTLKSYAKEIIGIDISKRMIGLARESYPDVRFIIADAEDLPFPDKVFDVVYCSAILHHLDIQAALKEIRRVLIPGGYLYIAAEPGLLNPVAWIRRTFFPSNIHTPDEKPFIPSVFRKTLYREGFKELVYYPSFIISPIIPVLGKRFPKIQWRPLLHFMCSLDRLFLKTQLREFSWLITGIYRSPP